MEWIIALLGLVLVGAPFVLGYQDQTVALWTSIGLGVVLAVVAGYKAIVNDKARWEDWLAVLAGLLAIALPFIFFSTTTAAVWTSVVIGALVVLLAGYRALVPPLD